MGGQMKRGAIAVGLDRLQAPETLPLSDGELCSLILNTLDSAIAGAKAPGVERPRMGLEGAAALLLILYLALHRERPFWRALGLITAWSAGALVLAGRVSGRASAFPPASATW